MKNIIKQKNKIKNQKFAMECKITKIVRELPLANIQKINKKPEFFYEMQNHKDFEGTAFYKHTKQYIHNMES